MTRISEGGHQENVVGPFVAGGAKKEVGAEGGKVSSNLKFIHRSRQVVCWFWDSSIRAEVSCPGAGIGVQRLAFTSESSRGARGDSAYHSSHCVRRLQKIRAHTSSKRRQDRSEKDFSTNLGKKWQRADPKNWQSLPLTKLS